MRNFNYNRKRMPRGQVVLGLVVFFMAVSLAFIIGFAEPALRTTQDIGDLALSRQSYFAAESAAEDVAYRFMSGKQTLVLQGPVLGTATSSVSTADAASVKKITGIGANNDYIRALLLALTNAATSGPAVYSVSGWGEQSSQ